jgi:hypothetical protein
MDDTGTDRLDDGAMQVHAEYLSLAGQLDADDCRLAEKRTGYLRRVWLLLLVTGY